MTLKKWFRKVKKRFRTLAQTIIHLCYHIAQRLHMVHSISQKRADFLEENFFELSSHDREPDRALFDSITDPAELHYLADIYNWDDGAEVLGWIVDSPYCDRGTAALVFWRSQPDFYTEYALESEMSLPDGVLPLLQRIMLNWEQGFYARKQIAYNRSEDPAAEKDYGNNPRRKWQIPAYLMEPTAGNSFLFN